MNSIIWFLTDTDFAAEWVESSFFQRLLLIYTTGGLLFFEILSFLSIFDVIF